MLPDEPPFALLALLLPFAGRVGAGIELSFPTVAIGTLVGIC
jgi:hypothetical protein